MSTAESVLAAVQKHRAGELEAAAAIYRDVLAREPEQPSALHLFGLLHLASGRAVEASALLARAARVRPGDAGTLVGLARAQLQAGAPTAALEAARRAIACDPDRAEGHFLVGTALNALGRPAEAEPTLRRAVALAPDHAAAHLNLGNALADLDRLEEAEALCRAATRLDPGCAEAHASLGFVLTSLGRLAEAIAACDAAIAVEPEFAQAHWNRATAQLLDGDFEAGFRGYEWRKWHDRYRRDYRDLPGPSWQGEPLAGRTLLVQAEQGMGDAIQFSRFLPGLAVQGAKIVLACDRRLVPLLATLPGVRVVDRADPPPRYDVWVDQMSLPRLLGIDAGHIPQAAGYLRADPALVDVWRARLPGGQRIGLVWAGNPAHSNDRRRSLPGEALRSLLDDDPGFVSLQVGPRAAEAGLPDLTPLLRSYADTAALVDALDLVVTVDTSVAHLAGALGKPVWVMLPFAPDWRWMLGRDDTPWYTSMRLFRQPAPGDWTGVAERVRAALARRADAPSSCSD